MALGAIIVRVVVKRQTPTSISSGSASQKNQQATSEAPRVRGLIPRRRASTGAEYGERPMSPLAPERNEEIAKAVAANRATKNAPSKEQRKGMAPRVRIKLVQSTDDPPLFSAKWPLGCRVSSVAKFERKSQTSSLKERQKKRWQRRSLNSSCIA